MRVHAKFRCQLVGMAAHQEDPLPSNPLLQSQVNLDERSLHLVAEDESQLLSQSQCSSKEGTQTKTPGCNASELNEQTARRKWFKLWWKEVLAIVFSLLCLAANIGFLVSLDQRPNQSWRVAKVDITPNAIISILATFNKASLLLAVAEVLVQLKWLYFQAREQRVSDLQVFDDASRGPLGSVQLLWGINLRVRDLPIPSIVADLR